MKLSGNTPEARMSQYWAQVVNRKVYQAYEKSHRKYDHIIPFLLNVSPSLDMAEAEILANKEIDPDDKESIIDGLRAAAAEVDALLKEGNPGNGKP